MRHRPPFGLVLVVFAAALGGAIALVGGGGGGHTSTPAASGPADTCVTAHAEAAAVATRTLRAPVEARIPVSVTESARGVTVTVSDTVVERAVATRALAVRRPAISARSACAHGATRDAARSIALTRAYKRARAAARARAKVKAAAAIRALAARELPSLVASGQHDVDAHAQSTAAAVRHALVAQAKARLP